jgi:hypothetical protein
MMDFKAAFWILIFLPISLLFAQSTAWAAEKGSGLSIDTNGWRSMIAAPVVESATIVVLPR